jgi:hypothetical protein
VASAVNAIDVFPSITTTRVYMVPFGGDANIAIGIASLGTQGVDILTNSTVLQASFAHTASAVNYHAITGSATGNRIVFSAAGTDTNVGMQYDAKGTSADHLFRAGSTNIVQFLTVASAVNYWGFTSSATGNRITVTPGGSDTNVGVSIQTKGTGTFQFVGEIAVAPFLQQTLSAAAATINWDMDLGSIAVVTLGANGPYTLAAPTNPKKGTYILHVFQDGTGSRTLAYNTVFKFTGGVPPVITVAASSHDVLTFTYDGTVYSSSYLPDVR